MPHVSQTRLHGRRTQTREGGGAHGRLKQRVQADDTPCSPPMSRATGKGPKFTTKAHRDKQHSINDRACRHAMSTRAPPPPPPPPPPPRPPPKREADPLECARTTHTSVRHPVPAKGRQLPAIGGATGAPAIVTGGGKRGGGVGGCGAAFGTTSAGSPTAGSCTGSRFNLIYSPTCCETCLDKCDISAELSRMFGNT